MPVQIEESLELLSKTANELLKKKVSLSFVEHSEKHFHNISMNALNTQISYTEHARSNSRSLQQPTTDEIEAKNSTMQRLAKIAVEKCNDIF